MSAAEAGGFDLPAAVLELATQALHLQRLEQENVRPKPHRDVDVSALVAGASLADIFDADDRHAFAESRWERGGALMIAARGHFTGHQLDTFNPIRDTLITGVLREAVAALVADAKRAADKLAKFSPDFPPALLAEANQGEMQTWRASRELQRRLEVFQTAWRTSWYAATRRGRGSVGLEFCPLRAGGWFAWTDPESVTPEELRLGHDVEVLKIASAQSVYRLASPSELSGIIETLEKSLPENFPQPARQLVQRGVCSN